MEATDLKDDGRVDSRGRLQARVGGRRGGNVDRWDGEPVLLRGGEELHHLRANAAVVT